MDLQKQFDAALEKIKTLEKEIETSDIELKYLNKVMDSFDGLIFRCKRNAQNDYIFTYSEGTLANKYKIKTSQILEKNAIGVIGTRKFIELKASLDSAFNGEASICKGIFHDGNSYSVNVYPLDIEPNNSVMEIFGVVRDITEIDNSNKENKKLLDLLNSIIEHNPYSIQILDAEGYHIRENRAYCDLFKAIPDKSWSILKDPIIRESGFLELLNKVIQGEIVSTPPIWYNAHNIDPQYEDNPVFIGSVIFPVFLSDGKLEYIVLMHENVTSRIKAEEELIVQKERAEESDRLKSAFLANMSHEIRTPMNGILGFAELLKNPQLSGDEQQVFISVIEKSGERMLNIINDLINISKVESGQMEVSMLETNINEQLDFLYNFFKLEALQKGIELIQKSPLPSNKAIIYTDREKLYAILTNLIKNAIKFTKDGFVEFGYVLKENMLEFYVKDSGIGISKEKQSSVFERFIQADVSLSRGYEGAGLGLSISKAYVELLGGSIWLESKEGIGSKFYFSFPVNTDVNEKISHNIPTAGIQEVFRQITILLAEDDEITLLYYSQILKNSKYKLLIANNGKEAVEMCENNSDIDLVLMDIKMPVMDGFTAAKLIREFRPNLTIIAQTAFALETEKQKYGHHFNDYITKPINFEELIQKINKYIHPQ